MDSRMKKLTQYVAPTILGNCAYFLFTIIDGIFVGQGVGLKYTPIIISAAITMGTTRNPCQ